MVRSDSALENAVVKKFEVVIFAVCQPVLKCPPRLQQHNARIVILSEVSIECGGLRVPLLFARNTEEHRWGTVTLKVPRNQRT